MKQLTRQFPMFLFLSLFICQTAWAGDDGPISIWSFDEGSGTVAADGSGGNSGTVTGAQWTSGRVGGALLFDGADDFVSVSSPAGRYPGGGLPGLYRQGPLPVKLPG